MPKIILVVDDDPSIVHLLKEDLEIEGYKVLDGYDGQTAIQKARLARPNLIILDVNMPLLGGLKTLEYLRESPDTQRIPVLFLTGESSGNVAPHLAEQPRVAYVKKPIDLDDLNSLVRQLLEKYPTEQPES